MEYSSIAARRAPACFLRCMGGAQGGARVQRVGAGAEPPGHALPCRLRHADRPAPPLRGEPFGLVAPFRGGAALAAEVKHAMTHYSQPLPLQPSLAAFNVSNDTNAAPGSTSPSSSKQARAVDPAAAPPPCSVPQPRHRGPFDRLLSNMRSGERRQGAKLQIKLCEVRVLLESAGDPALVQAAAEGRVRIKRKDCTAPLGADNMAVFIMPPASLAAGGGHPRRRRLLPPTPTRPPPIRSAAATRI